MPVPNHIPGDGPAKNLRSIRLTRSVETVLTTGYNRRIEAP